MALILASQSEVRAQVFVGANASVIDVRGATFGLGARVGAVVSESPDFTLVLEGVGEYLFPPCDRVDCSATAFQGNLLFLRQVASYVEAYGGFGILQQSFTLEKDEVKDEGDDLGLNFILGTHAGPPGGARPFLEVRLSVMDELTNQFGVSFGLRVPLG
jgi:hypothetical protein